MTSMATVKKQTNKKAINKQHAFIKEVKKGKYGVVEKTTIVYSRMDEQAQPYENAQKSVLFYGVR